MKKLLILLLLVLLLTPLAAFAGRPAPRRVPRTQLTSIVSEFRHHDGVESFHLGWFGTLATKGAARIAAEDPEDRAALALLDGVKDFIFFEYDGCSENLRDRIAGRIDRALEGCELLMEMSSDGTAMRVYGTMDDRTGKVRDIVLHNAGDCSLILIAGSVSMEALGRMMAND